MALVAKTVVQKSWLGMKAGLSRARRLRTSTQVSRAARFVRGGLADLLYPPSCVSCAAELDEHVASKTDVRLCDECFESMEIFSDPMCRRCGAPVPAVAS